MKPNLVYWLLAADTLIVNNSLLATWAIKGIELLYPGVPPVQIYWLLSADTLTVNICLLSIALHLSNLIELLSEGIPPVQIYWLLFVSWHFNCKFFVYFVLLSIISLLILFLINNDKTNVVII